MKLFQNLDPKHQERAIQVAEQIVIGNMVSAGIAVPTNAEADVMERFDKIAALIEQAKAMENLSDQAEFLMENELTGQMIFEQAYEYASTCLYIEKDEYALELSEIDSHFEDEDEETSSTNKEEESEDGIITSAGRSGKKDLSQLN